MIPRAWEPPDEFRISKDRGITFSALSIGIRRRVPPTSGAGAGAGPGPGADSGWRHAHTTYGTPTIID